MLEFHVMLLAYDFRFDDKYLDVIIHKNKLEWRYLNIGW